LRGTEPLPARGVRDLAPDPVAGRPGGAGTDRGLPRPGHAAPHRPPQPARGPHPRPARRRDARRRGGLRRRRGPHASRGGSSRTRARILVSHRVVVIGGGFGGLNAIQSLRKADVEITLIDRRNFHLFQPLTYQVATGALSPGEVAYPLRAIFKSEQKVRVLLAEVAGFDLEARQVHLTDALGLDAAPEPIAYDTLIIAAGSSYSY